MEIDFSKLPEENSTYYDYSCPDTHFNKSNRTDKSILNENGITNVSKLLKAYIQVKNKTGNYSRNLRDIIIGNFEYWYSEYMKKIYNTKQVPIIKLVQEQQRTGGKSLEYIKELVNFLDNNPDKKVRIVGLYNDYIIENNDSWKSFTEQEKIDYIYSLQTRVSTLDRPLNLMHKYGYGF